MQKENYPPMLETSVLKTANWRKTQNKNKTTWQIGGKQIGESKKCDRS